MYNITNDNILNKNDNNFEIVRKLKKLCDILQQNNLCEFRISTINESNTLIIIGSSDLSYYHYIEITFSGLEYLSCPTYMDDISFRIANVLEKEELLAKYNFDKTNIVICILEDMQQNINSKKYFIVAEKLEYKLETVYHYKRDNLKQNERIADWVK